MRMTCPAVDDSAQLAFHIPLSAPLDAGFNDLPCMQQLGYNSLNEHG